ncbi:MAG TPA: transcriptional regulator [Opitutae bacterium]|nr:transcriptional regulator [Opitutae bacterium]
MRKALGFDLGGTKFAFGVVQEDGTVLGSGQVETLAEKGAAQAVQRAIVAARDVLTQLNFKPSDLVGIGIASPGPLDVGKGCVTGSPNLPGWDNFPIGGEIAKAFGLPVRIDNDANAAAVGEHRFGAGKGKHDMVYVTLSTGIGGGAIVNNRLMRGANGNAAELGHLTLDIKGPKCPCGGNGCFEMMASGTAIKRFARAALTAGRTSAIATQAGGIDKVNARHVFAAAQAGDALAQELVAHEIEYLARGFAVIINTFNPERIVVGGGVASAGEWLLGPVRTRALALAFPRLASACDIVPAALAANVGVVGAAACAFEQVGS